jgi:transposase-like protein
MFCEIDEDYPGSPKRQLIELYEGGESIGTIAKKFGICRTSVVKRMKKYGIKPRTKKEAVMVSIEKNRWSNFGMGRYNPGVCYIPED